MWGYGYQIQEGPHRGLWRIDPDSKQAPENLVATDPYGFAEVVNRYRMAAGLAPLAYDQELSVWAAHNNVKQCSHGLGHHVSPNCNQNCAGTLPTPKASPKRGWNRRVTGPICSTPQAVASASLSAPVRTGP